VSFSVLFLQGHPANVCPKINFKEELPEPVVKKGKN
jgi:hypothetical protein